MTKSNFTRSDDYPEWICDACGVQHGKYSKTISCWHKGICGWCKKEDAVTEPRDFAYPKFFTNIKVAFYFLTPFLMESTVKADGVTTDIATIPTGADAVPPNDIFIQAVPPLKEELPIVVLDKDSVVPYNSIPIMGYVGIGLIASILLYLLFRTVKRK